LPRPTTRISCFDLTGNPKGIGGLEEILDGCNLHER
jgi:hypothetical protein